MSIKKDIGSYLFSNDSQNGLNPGEALRDYLMEVYPVGKDGFIDLMDNDLSADGELKSIVYDSSIYYIIRRLVTTMEFIHRTNGDNELTTRVKLKSHLEDTTRFSNVQLNKLIRLLIPCLETARDDFSDGDKNFVKKHVKNNDWQCFVCGKEFSASHTATADHLWPRALGGLSTKANLRYVCQPCNNNYKRDFLGGSDYHYEEIAFSLKDYDHYVKAKLPKWLEIAIFAKSDYKCEVCSQPAFRVGELFIGRKDLNSGWHYLNLTSYCFNHKPE